MKNISLIIVLVISSNFCASQDLIHSGEKFLIEGQFFTKKESYPITGIITIENEEVGKVNNDGGFELVFNDISQISFPLKISFQSTGFHQQHIYFENLEELLKIKYCCIPLYFDEYNNDLGLIYIVKISIWHKIKHFLMKPFKKKKVIFEVN